MPKSENLVLELTKALRERQVIEAIGAILEEKLSPVMDAIRNVEHENTILVKSLTVATEQIEELGRQIKSENLILVGIQSQSFAEAAGRWSYRLKH